MKKIFILLPHKEKFSKKNSGSASIWVKDFFKPSKYKKNISVYGSNVLKKNATIKSIYNNIDIRDSKYQSKTNQFLKKFKIHIKKFNPSIIEIHNRPNYVIDIYKDESLGSNKKSLTVRVTYGSDDRTLSGDEIDECEKSFLSNLSKKISFDIRA